MKKFLSLVLALILVMSMALGMVSCDTTDDPSNDTQQTEANELEEAKAAAKTALESYVNSENYRDAEKTLLETAIADGKTAIDAATTSADITSALNSAKALIDAIKTDAVLTAEELVAAKNTAKTVLEGYANAENYRDAQKAELATAIANGKSAIEGAADITAVSNALATAKAAIDEIKTDAEFTAEELLSAKNTAKAELDIYVNATDYRAEQQTALATAIADGKAAIEASADITAVNTALANAKVIIDGIKTNAELTAEELVTAKADAKTALDSYVSADDYRTEQQTALATAIANGKSAIDAATDITAVSTALANAKAVIDEIKTDAELTAEELAAAKTEAKATLDAYVNINDYRTEQQTVIADAIANGKNAIDAATTKAGVTSALDSAKLSINAIKTDSEMTAEELASAKQVAKNALANYVNADDYREAQKTELSLAITTGNNAIDVATDIAAVNTALANAKAVIDEIKTNAEFTAEELVAAKTAAKTTLESYKNANDYREAQKVELQSAITNGKNAIDNATDKAGVEAALANAKSAIDAIETDAEITAKEPTISTPFDSNTLLTSARATLDVYAKDAQGNKLPMSKVTVTVNGEAASVNWDDHIKTSYNFVFVEGENTVVITATDGTYTKVKTYTVICDLTKPTTVTVSIEAFTVGLGYLVAPVDFELNDQNLSDMAEHYGYESAEAFKEKLSMAHVLDYVLYTYGLEMDYQGSLESTWNGFYMSAISGIADTTISVPEKLAEALEMNGYYIDEYVSDEGTLCEFDVTWGSGWMYTVNGAFPNIPFCDYVPQDGDVMRVQFTLAYGSDIGDWGFMGEPFFELVDRDTITKLIAKAISLDVIDVQDAIAVVSTFGVTQDELDAACAELEAAINAAR